MNNLTGDGGLDLSELKFVELEAGEVDRYTLRPGDILFNRTNSPGLVGKMALWDRPEAYALAGYLVRVRVDESRVEPGFAVAWFNTPWMKAELRARAKPSGSLANISASELRKFELPLPSVAEQRRVMKLLDLSKALREKRWTATALLGDAEAATYERLFGDPLRNSMGWPTATLGEVVTTSSGGTPSRKQGEYFGGGVPWVKSGELHERFVTSTEERLTELGLARSSAKVMPPGTVLLAMYGATAGAVSVLGIEAATNQAVCCITPGPRLVREYLVHALRRFLPTLLAKRVGGAQPNLSQDTIRNLAIPIPPLDLQTKFATAAGELERMRRAHSAALEVTERLFGALQASAFRGEA